MTINIYTFGICPELNDDMRELLRDHPENYATIADAWKQMSADQRDAFEREHGKQYADMLASQVVTQSAIDALEDVMGSAAVRERVSDDGLVAMTKALSALYAADYSMGKDLECLDHRDRTDAPADDDATNRSKEWHEHAVLDMGMAD